jgi:hypothetical protein
MTSSRHHAQTRHPGTADAAHRHARAGLQERNGRKPTRGARAPRPATLQHRVGRRRRGSDERQRTLCERKLLVAFPAGAPMSLLFYWYGVRSKEQVAQIAPDGPHPPRGTLPHACRTHGAKNPSPCGRRPVGNAPPRRGRMGEMDTSRKRSPPLAGKGKIQVSELVSHTACAHPLGVAERMRLVRCEVPPSMPACGAYLLCPPVAVRL